MQFLSFFIKRSLLHRDTNFAQPVDSPFCLRIPVQRTIMHFGKIPKKIGQNLATIRQNSGKICKKLHKIFKFKFCKKSAKFSAIFNEKIESRERCKTFQDLRSVLSVSQPLRSVGILPLSPARRTRNNISIPRRVPCPHAVSSDIQPYGNGISNDLRLMETRQTDLQICSA